MMLTHRTELGNSINVNWIRGLENIRLSGRLTLYTVQLHSMINASTKGNKVWLSVE